MTLKSAQDVLTYWYETLEPKDWWVGGPDIDQAITAQFGATVEVALRGELYPWRTSPQGRLAEVICLDQFTRNIFRGQAKAFAGDPLALILAQEAILGGFDRGLSDDQKAFLYMPLMHSESLPIHQWADEVFRAANLEGNLKALREHTEVIAEFGRYPSRNKALGRASSAEELAYLKNGKTWGQGSAA